MAMNPALWLKRLLAAVLALAALLVLALAVTLYLVVAMPGDTLRGGLPAADAELQAAAARLRGHVEWLAGGIGERNATRMDALGRAADHIAGTLRGYGYQPVEARFGVQAFRNIAVELPGRHEDAGILVVGAHYDSAPGTPGADDNASGVAVLLEIARALAGQRYRHGIRLLAFPNEESPWFGTDLMGSLVSARAASERGDKLIGMFSLEMLGYYSDQPGSQFYPPVIRAFYPDRGNFVALVGNFPSRGLLHRAIAGFRATGAFPSEGMAAPEWLVEDIRRSDNSSYWRQGVPALMITDTSNFRNPHYHTADDLPDTLDYESMARVARGLSGMLESLAREE